MLANLRWRIGVESIRTEAHAELFLLSWVTCGFHYLCTKLFHFHGGLVGVVQIPGLTSKTGHLWRRRFSRVFLRPTTTWTVRTVNNTTLRALLHFARWPAYLNEILTTRQPTANRSRDAPCPVWRHRVLFSPAKILLFSEERNSDHVACITTCQQVFLGSLGRGLLIY